MVFPHHKILKGKSFRFFLSGIFEDMNNFDSLLSGDMTRIVNLI